MRTIVLIVLSTLVLNSSVSSENIEYRLNLCTLLLYSKSIRMSSYILNFPSLYINNFSEDLDLSVALMLRLTSLFQIQIKSSGAFSLEIKT